MEGPDNRLARIEVKLDYIISRFEEHREEQSGHNDRFYETRDEVRDMRSKAGIISALGLGAAGVVAWLTSLLVK